MGLPSYLMQCILMNMKRALRILIASSLFLPSVALAQYYYPSSNYQNYQMPQMYWCGTYYSYSPCASTNYAYHNFSPYTNINTSPYVNVSAPQYTYPTSYSYSYPSYSYSYPSYSYPSYTYPSYSYNSYDYYDYWYSYPQYQSYSYPTYTYDYGYNSYDYCYSGYGCYPNYVADPHQWIYDSWTGTWY